MSQKMPEKEAGVETPSEATLGQRQRTEGCGCWGYTSLGGDLWVTESELLLLKTFISLNCLAGWDQTLWLSLIHQHHLLQHKCKKKFLYKVTKWLQLSLKWEDKFEVNFQKSLIYWQRTVIVISSHSKYFDTYRHYPIPKRSNYLIWVTIPY